MNIDNARSLAETALNSLLEAVEQGRSETLKAWLETLAKFRHYSLGNQLLIASQRPDASRVAGFHTWKSLGRFVRKGEKGIWILAPMVFRATSSNDDQATESTSCLRFRSVVVFDISQTEGEPLPELETTKGDPGIHLDRLKKFIGSAGITFDYSDAIRPALGTSSGGHISVVPGLGAAEEFSVIVHELAHELLHQGADRPASKTVRETEAEATAFAVCRHIGLETGTAAQDYIALYNGDRGALVQSLTAIRDIAAKIIAALDVNTKTEDVPA